MTDTTPLIRTRTIALARPANQAVVAQLAASDGIAAIRTVADGRRLEISYDLHRMTLADLEARLRAGGFPLSNGLFARWARAWAAFKDENRRDSAEVVHQCCSVPPEGK